MNANKLKTALINFLKSRQLIIFLSIVLIFIFVKWLLTTLMPVLLVEIKYQYKSLLQNVFHVSDLRALIIPDFRFLDLRGRSLYKDYGINIPAIFVDEPVIFNVDPNDKVAYKTALKNGIAHASSTAFPDNPGIGYYFAHSSSDNLVVQYNAVFYLLGKLKSGDDIYVWHEGKQFRYLVTETRVTEADDVSFLDQEYEKETIVLQTCWPPGTTQKRFLVFAERKELD